MIELTQEQEMTLNTVKDITRKKIKSRAAEIDEKAEFSWDTAMKVTTDVVQIMRIVTAARLAPN